MKREACYAFLLVACHADAEPAARDHRPTVEVVPIARDAWCVTHGTIQGTRISDEDAAYHTYVEYGQRLMQLWSARLSATS